jgi:AraC family transcriptional regulator, ethanolamine operon transcriptional activator
MTAAAPPSESAPSPFRPGVGVSFETADPALLGNAVPGGWEIEYLQLGFGRFQGHIMLGQTARMQFLTKDWNTGMAVRGTAPAGIAILGGPLRNNGPSLVRGLAVEENEIGFIRSGLELDFRSLEAEHLFMVAVPDHLLERHAMAVLGQPLTSLSRGSRLRTRGGAIALQQWFAKLNLAALCREPERLADPVVAAWVENRVLDGLIGQVATSDRPANVRGGIKLARQVDAYLRSNLQAPLTISDLCTAIGVPERTLHKAVRTHLGLSPKALLKTLRLNAVRRELLAAAPGTGVMDVAMRWGFFHAGWFSQDYRQQFGETPSATLRRAGP